MTARLLRDAMVDIPQRMGWRKTLAIRLVGLALVAAGALLLTELPASVVVLALGIGGGVMYLAGGVWQWRIRRRQRTDRPDRWREREARRG